MTVTEIRERVALIRYEADDDEAAHIDEDLLHRDVLKAIASGEYSIEEMVAFAEEALATLNISFARWCA